MKNKQNYWLLSSLLLLTCSIQDPDGTTTTPGVPSMLNPDDCTNTDANTGLPLKPCASGTSCDIKTHTCIVGQCTSAIQCLDHDDAQCLVDSHVCTTCVDAAGGKPTDTFCSVWTQAQGLEASAPAPYCRLVTDPQQNRDVAVCAECWPDALATADAVAKPCKDAAKPACLLRAFPHKQAGATGNYYTYVCDKCQVDTDCGANGICRKDGDFPETLPASANGLATGQCVPDNLIAYASSNLAGCDDGGTMNSASKPYCSINTAIGSGRPFVRLVPGNYPNQPISTGNVILIGPGRDASPTAVLQGLTVTGGTVSLSATQVIGTGNAAVSCTNSGTIYMRDAVIRNTSGRGFDAEQGCAKLYIDRTRFTGSQNYGLVIGTAGTTMTDYRITNTAMTLCGTTLNGEEQAVLIGSKTTATSVFAFNTVANGNSRGINCTPARQITDSIIQGNTNANVEGACALTRVVTSGANLDAGQEPKLHADSTCCVDKGLPPTFNFQGTFRDYYLFPRSTTTPDIGYNEVN